MAFSFAQRWNDPRLVNVRKNWAAVREEISGKSADEINAFFKEKAKLRIATAFVLNFFEEMAIAIHLGVADEETLKRIFRTMVVGCYKDLSPWIGKRREKKKRLRIWVEFEDLYDSWKKADKLTP